MTENRQTVPEKANRVPHGRVTAYIHMDAILENLESVRKIIPDDARILAVLKADGYGHGAVPIARKIEKEDYIWGVALAAVSEAKILRENGFRKPILILGYTFDSDYEWMAENGVRPVLFTAEMAEQFSQAAVRVGKVAPFHTAVDTGMSRIGFFDSEESICELEKIVRLPGLFLEGIFTHFAKADEADKTSAQTQQDRFVCFCDKLKKRIGRGDDLICHSANSAAIIDLPQTRGTLVRSGIITYGIYPSDEVDRQSLRLRAAMELKSTVAYVKTIPAGTAVSYGGTYVAARETEVATIPVGYADGYPRSLSNVGDVLIHGKRAPIIGRICMDQFMVDVTGMDVHILDEVTLMGRDGEECITVEELSERSGRFPYEFVCDIGARVPRVCV